MTEPTDDFAAMFEASRKAKRIEKGQLLEGTVVAIGSEVAFVDVGGKVGQARTGRVARLADFGCSSNWSRRLLASSR